MAVQTKKDSRYDHYNPGELFPNWSWYFRTFPDERDPSKMVTTHVSTLEIIHHRLGDLEPVQQIKMGRDAAGQEDDTSLTFKAGLLLTPDFHAKVNWAMPHEGFAIRKGPPATRYLKGVVTELAKNSFGDRQITLLHERGLERYLIPNLMCPRFISAGPDEDGDASGVFLFSFPF